MKVGGVKAELVARLEASSQEGREAFSQEGEYTLSAPSDGGEEGDAVLMAALSRMAARPAQSTPGGGEEGRRTGDGRETDGRRAAAMGGGSRPGKGDAERGEERAWTGLPMDIKFLSTRGCPARPYFFLWGPSGPLKQLHGPQRKFLEAAGPSRFCRWVCT